VVDSACIRALSLDTVNRSVMGHSRLCYIRSNRGIRGARRSETGL